MNCKTCNKVLNKDNAYIRDGKFRRTCRKCSVEECRIRRIKRRAQKYKFLHDRKKSCVECGYSKNYSALCFHHVNPNEKLMGVPNLAWSDASYDAIQEEIDKCIVLCLNCHAELHNPDLDIT